MKKVLSIHEITPEILAIPKEVLSEYVLTFDDGLYSQYVHREHFSSIPTSKVYFISPGILHRGKEPQQSLISSAKAHEVFFDPSGISLAFMTLEQVKHLKSYPNTIIGGHSFMHFKESVIESEAPSHKGLLEYKFTVMKEDTEKMVQWFDKELKQKVNYFCYPYNNTYNGLYTAVVQKLHKIPSVFGDERILIEDLL